MPKHAIDYSKTIVYQIRCDELEVGNIYIGSTTDFIKRKSNHKSNCNNEKSKSYNYKIYEIIRNNGGWNNWKMIQVEEYPCENNRQAEEREEYWRKKLNADLNMYRSYITEDEKNEYIKSYYDLNSVSIKEKSKTYYNTNRDKVRDRQKEYEKEHAEEIKERKRMYREENKEKFKEISRKYREENREKIKQKRRERYSKDKK